jgi:photoactive yellow protein
MATSDLLVSAPDFRTPDLWEALEVLHVQPALYDSLTFGLVAMDLEGTVIAYNTAEAKFAGIAAQRQIGLNFFREVAPCTNNYIVAGRFEDESHLDETIPYTFTVKMRPARVRLRLLKRESGEREYLAVEWN